MDFIHQNLNPNPNNTELITNYNLAEMMFEFDLAKNDNKNIQSVDPLIRSLVESGLQKINMSDSKEINKIIDRNTETKNKYISDTNNTYQLFRDSIEASFKNRSEKIEIQICGTYKSGYRNSGTTIEDWKKNNVAKWNVINFFIQQLEAKGWRPRVTLNDIKCDAEGYLTYYSGGDVLILTCDISSKT